MGSADHQTHSWLDQNRVIWQCKKESGQKKERGGQREKKGEVKGNASEEKTGPLCLCDGPLKWD